jgi:hypothetical protein
MRVIDDTMGYHISSVSRAVRNVTNVLCDIAGQYITWPSTDVERNIIKTGFMTLPILLAMKGQLIAGPGWLNDLGRSVI